MKNFKNLYQIPKTLRFELQPIGSNGLPLSEEDAKEIFTKILEHDRKIKEAYIALKPVMDKIHESVINTSLTSKEAKQIDFNDYFDKYKQKQELKSVETYLRNKIANTFEIGIQQTKKEAGYDAKGKPILKKKGIECLTEKGILKYIEKNIDTFVTDNLSKADIQNYLTTFENFFTYFSGYNQNRENYYAKQEQSTAIATRIVHDNLPKFCDNIILFANDKSRMNKKTKAIEIIPNRKKEYLNAYQFLKDNNKTTQIKDAQSGKMIEAYAIEESMFKVKNFSECLSQAGIEEYNKVIGHYNLLINLYNQSRKEEKDFKKLALFKTLYKQIGCGKKKVLFYAIKYDTREEQDAASNNVKDILNLKEVLEIIGNSGKKYFGEHQKSNELNIYEFIKWLKGRDNWDGIYWSKKAVNIISNIYLANWYDVQNKIQEYLQSKDKNVKGIKEKLKSVAAYSKKRDEQFSLNDAVELSGLFEILDENNDKNWSKAFFKNSILEEKKSLINENLTPSQNLINMICDDIEILAKDFCKETDTILKIDNYNDKDKDKIFEIKKWLDNSISIIRIIKYFLVRENKVKGNAIDSELSNMLSALLYADDTKWLNWYDAVRNYLTKKPQDDVKENKLKLNFNNGTLAQGWDVNKEPDNSCVILQKNNSYYIAIMDKKFNKVFDEKNIKTSENNYKKLVYKQLGDIAKQLPRIVFSKKWAAAIPPDIKKIKETEIYKTNNNDCQKLISFYKKFIIEHKDWNRFFKFRFRDNYIYENISEFYNEVESQFYSISFCDISENYINKLIEEKKIFLFQIYSKDFSTKSTGNKNLQTMYWDAIFNENSFVKLLGGGELFFREIAIEKNKLIKHEANVPICRKSDGKTESVFSHDIFKDKRFSSEKYFLHVPIKINYHAADPKRVSLIHFNNEINNCFAQAENILFLGIDRGEKHLIYYSLIDTNGKIIEQNHLDTINKKDYLKEINDASTIRKEKQENWQQKGNIRNLKDGYMSLVVHEIIEKMKDKTTRQFKPTFIVLEDLNSGFKRFRQKFEQQVYQKFELALAKKLNYLVDKNAKDDEIGTVNNALQLTAPIQNYQDMEGKKQVGIMLYTRANYTSVTDPVTGWRKTIYLKKGSEEDIKKQILEKFSNIGIDEYGDYFFQYTNENTKENWTLWSSKNGKSLERYRFKRGNAKNESIILSFDIKTDYLDKLFYRFNKQESLLQQLKDGVELSKADDNYTAWESFRFVIDLIQQIRNSGDVQKNQDDNFLLSPVRNEQGEHFDSRRYQNCENPPLPKDGDANGAYNIARKGIIMYEHIKRWIE
jgi:CRISPR-associated protein Cpf1